MKINKILAIAINDYYDRKLNNLNNCKNDIDGILELLNQKYIFADQVYLYKKEDTTRKKLYQRLTDYFTNTLEDENILLIFAGHGEYNPNIKTAYWQPSDADPEDPSSWLNISDILIFIKFSRAHHVSIISDSCFSGALFSEPYRGGGLKTYREKKSRQAITSGGIEKVLDGKAGEKSPFAMAILEVLKTNEMHELPFNTFSHNVAVLFGPDHKQTPVYGNLVNIGHDGGTFVFELKIKATSNDKGKKTKANAIDPNSEIKLSERETELIFFITSGLNNKEISAKLLISETAIELHRKNILFKMAPANQQKSIKYTIETGYNKLGQNVKVKLTPKEEQILHFIADGLSSREMGHNLFIAESTVETHKKNIISKLDFTNSKQLMKYALEKGYGKSLPDKEIEFTQKEIEILHLIADGLTSKAIGNKLFISENTVETHRKNLLGKLKLPNSKHLMKYGIERGYGKS